VARRGTGNGREQAPGAADAAAVGLCTDCRHARVQRSARGSAFWRCALAEDDSRFARYPKLPVRSCAGFRPADPAEPC